MDWLSNKLFYTIGITLLCGGLHAQSLAEAKKLYNEGKYAEAKPAFEKLVKQAPSNSSYNHWYGVCCYETGDLTGAEKHLKVAVKRKVQEAYRYMSEVYYKTYRFDEAGEMLEEYILLQIQSAGGYGIPLSSLGNRIRMRFGDFKVRDYGFSQFKQYIASFPDVEFVDDGERTRAVYMEE